MSEGAVNYRFLSVIGEGGFGRVYRARMETSDGFHRDVAIKILTDPDPPRQLLERFRDEARILGLVRDRAFVVVQPPITVGGRWAVVMEFVDGVSAGAMVHNGRIPPGVAVEIVGEVARALHHAFHMEGPEGAQLQLLHRDIKPDNIQLTPSGEVRLLDFGIARANFAEREFKTRHSLGGTPGYIAPERLQGIELPAGDVYSLGVVLHELVTASRPRYAATVHLDLDADASELAAELDVAPELLDDPSINAVLRLAAQMRASEPEARPTARLVEDACRRLRQTLPPPYFREWAEEQIPHRMELEKDDLVSQVLVATHGSVPMTPAPVATTPNAGDDRTITLTPPSTPAPNLALGALVGGGAALVLGGSGVVFILLGLVGIWMYVNKETTSAPQLPDPVPFVLPDDPVVDDPVPDDPVPVVPVMPEPKPVVVIDDPTPIPVPDPVPVIPVPDPVPTMPTGRVVVKTVPSGATVRVKGQTLTQSGLGYELPIGPHTLEITSPGGEVYRVPVKVERGKTTNICYSFDTNLSCDAAP